LDIVTTLEVVIRYRESRYLLVGQFKYADGTAFGDALREGPWAPPAHALSLVLPSEYGERIETTQEIMHLFSEFGRKYKWRDEARRLQAMLGVTGGELSKVGEFVEIKPSYHNPGMNKAYKIVRVRWSNKNQSAGALRNLTDPLCLRGFAYLPISRKTLRDYNLTRDLEIRRPLFILGKPLVSNLKHVLCNGHFQGSLREPYVDVTDEHLVLKEEGLLAQADMAGFGEACMYIAKRSTPVRTGERQAEEYRRTLVQSFSDILARAGINQARLTGDGFLCGLPKRADNKGKLPRIIGRLLDAYSAHLEKIEEMTRFLPVKERRRYSVGSRLALHYGRYDYGRVAGLIPLVADFDGSEIVAVSRAESALKVIGDKIDKQQTRTHHHLDQRAHRAIVSQALAKVLGGLDELKRLMAEHQFAYEKRHIAKMKEAKVVGFVFRWAADL
jgi:hypothetical protein